MHDILTALQEFFFDFWILHKNDLCSKHARKQASTEKSGRKKICPPRPIRLRRFEHNSRRGKESTRIVGVGVSQPPEAFLSTGVQCAFLGEWLKLRIRCFFFHFFSWNWVGKLLKSLPKHNHQILWKQLAPNMLVTIGLCSQALLFQGARECCTSPGTTRAVKQRCVCNCQWVL